MYTFLFISKIHPNTGNKGSKSKSSIKSCYISLLRYMFLDGPIPNCNEGFNNSFWFYCNFFLKVSSCSEDKTWIWKKKYFDDICNMHSFLCEYWNTIHIRECNFISNISVPTCYLIPFFPLFDFADYRSTYVYKGNLTFIFVSCLTIRIFFS